MRILIDIGHPGHVHLFRNFALNMQNKGHKVLFTARQKEFEIELLTAAGFDFTSFGEHRATKMDKIKGLFRFTYQMLRKARRFKADLFMSHGSPYAAWVAAILRKPHIAFEDTGNWEQVRLYLPFTKAILTSDVFPFEYPKKQIRYRGHHEIAYLSPNYFKPNKNIFKYLGITEGTRYSILRFVSWNATHDEGQSGMTSELKEDVLNKLLDEGYKVFISGETELPDKFKPFMIKIPPQMMHDALYFAEVFVGEGATMAMEAGVLGTASFYINTLERSYCQDLEKYDLCYNFTSSEGVMNKLSSVLAKDNLFDTYKSKARQFMNDKIDVTSFTEWFIENYPESFKVMTVKPDFQDRFVNE